MSIVITNRDYGRFLRECVDSALAQSLPGVEVVVVDDGSTDDSREILRSYADAITLVPLDGRGQAAALNAGIAASRGELVLLLDADDRLGPEAARALAGAWRPGVARVQGVVELMDGDGAPAGGRLPTSPPVVGDARGLIRRGGGYATTGTTGVAYARAALDRLLPIPEEEWARCPDSYLLVLAPFVGRLAGVDRVVGAVRIHGANKWSMAGLDPQRLVDYLETDRLKERLLRRRADELGCDVPDDWLAHNPIHLQSRLALLRAAPELHPYPGDRAWRLGLQGARASLGHRAFTARKRVLMAGWFLAAALLPAPLARPLVRAGFQRSARPAWLQRLIEGGGRQREADGPGGAAGDGRDGGPGRAPGSRARG